MGERMNENPKCRLHIPQHRKGIYVLNIIVQSIFEKRGCEGRGSQRNTQNPDVLQEYENLMEMKTLKPTPRETKQHTCEAKSQSLPNLTKKRIDEKLDIQLN